jgi:protein-L-isoaspartate(D-aspartate) O-methyltransferase
MAGWLAPRTISSGTDGQGVSEPVDAFQEARQAMVHEQLEDPERAIIHPQILDAMRRVPRHEFVPGSVRADAYRDSPLPIGYGQTISQPFIVGLMTECLQPKPTDRILEIGTGSGYQAAVLSQLVAEVYSIEIIEALAQRAAHDLSRLGFQNVHVRWADGYHGWPEAAPFDAIIVTCAPDQVPQPLQNQLKENGQLIVPVGGVSGQELVLLHKHAGQLEQRNVLSVRFVPMTGRATGQSKST